MPLTKIKTSKLYRTLELPKDGAIDVEKRTVEMTFSSEEPCERYYGQEVLDHESKSIRLTRLKQGGAILVDHNRGDHVGVIEEVNVGDDRKCHAKVRFGKSNRANEIFNDIIDGIRRFTSVGYIIHRMQLEEKDEVQGISKYRAVDWEPLEISIVSVPADVTVGIGRALEGETSYDVEVYEPPKPPEETREIKTDQRKDKKRMEKCLVCGTDLVNGKCPACEARNEAREKETSRIREITAIGQKHNQVEMATKYIAEGKSIDDFRASILDAIPKPAALAIETKIYGENGQEMKYGPFRSFGEQMGAVANSDIGGKVDERLFQVRDISGMSSTVPSDGGFLVQTDFTSELLKRTYDTAQLASRCKKYPISANSDGFEGPMVDETSRATGSRLGGVQVYRASEADKVTSKKPKFGKFEIRLEDLKGLCYITERLLKDTTALEAFVSDSFVEEMGFKIDDEIVRGTGAGQCLGILNSSALVTVAKETSPAQSADTVISENIEKMYARMWTRSLASAIWLINQEVWPQLFKLSHTFGSSTTQSGTPVFMPPNGLSQAPFGMLMGRAILPIEQCSALGDVGDIVLVDLSQYLLIDKGGIEQASSVHVRFEYDEMTYKFNYRVNGQPVWKTALTPYKGASTVSPFIALAERA
jgi:HK97 family phage major capsid protein